MKGDSFKVCGNDSYNDAEMLDSEELIENEIDEAATPHTKLDSTIKTQEGRVEIVQKIIEETSPEHLTPFYIDKLTEYIIEARPAEEKRKFNTANRMKTINTRETSFEGLCANFENGEDGIYNIISDLGKNTILDPKDPITQEEIDSIPALRELVDAIEKEKEIYTKASGRRKFLLRQQIKEMQQDQYVIRNEMSRKWLIGSKASKIAKSFAKVIINDNITFDENGEPVNTALISLFNPQHIEALLCNYSGLKEAGYGQFKDDLYYLMEDLDKVCESALAEFPLYKEIVIYKIDGKQNIEIQELLEEHFGIKHSVEYISSLWRNKIPKLIAEKAKEEYLLWYYTTQERGKWKRCSRCKEIKLAHNRFFSKNKTSKDGWYSICKCCRNAKTKEAGQTIKMLPK